MSITMLQSTKKVFRKAMTSTLRDLTQSDLQSQSEAIVAKILALPAFKSCKTISCYLSMPTAEAQTTALILRILADGGMITSLIIIYTVYWGIFNAGKKLFVPSLTSNNGHMDFVRLYNEEDFRTLPAGLWGIPEPTVEWEKNKRQNVLDSSCEGLDLILLPGQQVSCQVYLHEVEGELMPGSGVAFDRSRSRLGHGKGYYDRFLSSYKGGANKEFEVALSLQQQLLDAGQVPVSEYDWKMDMIITPDDIITPECGHSEGV
ncbi:hypothetical protein PAXRUDRAFT_12677 [Paxillus rubicundulus Ve08.2h10]|uniref:5-formyltetrahydrofolate cyclo-ligase n=1 Tax=Paxillus rubicundulus Ve08.2h10 TaxID=930991 RepID=A0A0D0D8X0_9AGAM|nr:hypothetical protein PAXRUDRAFT_12677 [Paxillus rubicundulus Ve08.2h10]